MHELSICQALVDQLRRPGARSRRIASPGAATRRTDVGVVRAALHAFRSPRRNGRDGAAIAIEDAPVARPLPHLWLRNRREPGSLVCGDWCDFRHRPLTGDELLLVSVELERGP